MLTYTDIVMEAVEYTWPLFILDTFHVKSYVGVSEQVLLEKRKNWIQVNIKSTAANHAFLLTQCLRGC